MTIARLGLCLLVLGHPDLATAQARTVASEQRAPTTPSADQPALRAVIERYLAAYAGKDVQAYRATWHPDSPDGRSRAGIAPLLFQSQDVAFSNLRITRWTADAAAPTARVVVEAVVTDTRRTLTDRRTWIRTFTFRQDAGGWKIWRESSAAADLAAVLVARDSEQERLSLLDADPELVTDDLRAAVARLATTAMVKGGAKDSLGLLKLAVTIAERIGSPASIGPAWMDLGLQFEAGSDMPSALAAFSKALAAFVAAGNKSRVAATEMNMASVSYRMAGAESDEGPRLRLYAEAADHYRQALEGYESVGETGWNASILHSLGNTSYLLGRWEDALGYYRRTLAIQDQALIAAGEERTMLQVRGVAAAHQAIGMVLKEQGDYQPAVESFTKGLEKFASYDDTSGMANIERQIGETFRLQGAFTFAVRHFLAALEIAGRIRPDARDRPNEARLLASIGEIYGLEQRYAAALDYFQRSLEILQKTNERQAMAGVLGGIGGVHLQRGECAQAIEFYRKSLALREQERDRRGVALTLAQIGLAQTADGKPAEAYATYQKSLEAAEAAGDKEAEAIALALLASAALAGDRTDEALDLAGRAAARADAAGSLDALAQAKLVAGDAFRVRGEMGPAEAAVRDAMVAVERIRAAGIRADERFFNDTISPYTAMVHLLVRQSRTGDAFAMLERARQVRMQALLGDGVVLKGLTAEEQEQDGRLRRRVASLRTQLRKANDQPRADMNKVAALSTGLAEATAAQKDFESRLYDAHPDLKMLRAKSDPQPLAVDAADVVDSNTALLEFAVTETATHLFAITRSRAPSPATGNRRAPDPPAAFVVEVYTIDIKSADLAKQVAAFRELLASPASEPVLAATSLHDLLLAPAGRQIAGTRRILVVPDGALWNLPFQALRSGAGRYVIEDRAVAYGPSLSALAAIARRAKAQRPPEKLRAVSVGLADPGPAAAAVLALVRPDLKQAPMLQPEAEARGVGVVFPTGRARTHVGREATVDRVREEAKAAGVVHLAVPGMLVDASPLHSLFAFAPPAPDAPAGPFVELDDIMGWDVGARLVVMTRVQGDPGQQSAGAAARALAWAWFVAGVPTTVMTQWVVDAPSTTALMQDFHRRLAAGAVPPRRASEALRLATLPLLAGRSRHPHYWAGFTVMGDTR